MPWRDIDRIRKQAPLIHNITSATIDENKSECLSAQEYRAILRTSLDGFLLLDGEGRPHEVNETLGQ